MLLLLLSGVGGEAVFQPPLFAPAIESYTVAADAEPFNVEAETQTFYVEADDNTFEV